MPHSKHLLIGSTEAYSGKSATVLGLGLQLRQRGIDIAYGKPIGTCFSDRASESLDEDVQFIAQMLEIADNRLRPTLLSLDADTIQKQFEEECAPSYPQQIAEYLDGKGEDLLLLEGPGTLEEGTLFGLSLPQLAAMTEAQVLLVARFHSVLIVDGLLAAKEKLGNRLMGVLINDVPEAQLAAVETKVKACLERHQIPVLGILPRTPIMRSVSVGELVHQLNADILCCPERTDLMVEKLSIGAMNVNSALKYFRKADNMAVVTGGDRADIQLAALETSTQCLILTGHIPPKKEIMERAKDLEVPILSVDLDTLTTVEIIERSFDQVRLQEPIKVKCSHMLMEKHFDIEQLMAVLNLKPAVTA
ncbi:MAG: phosphotransacetylase family protein [Leptolyngbya sp. SIO4C1]|nr:phosphotransacetylase family protein [Leptolyngbya sp. SIO4C1]